MIFLCSRTARETIEPTTFPLNDCASRSPSPVTITSAWCICVMRSVYSATKENPGRSSAPIANSPPARPPAAPVPSPWVTSTSNSSWYRAASVSSRRSRSLTSAGDAPFCGAKVCTASTKEVVTSTPTRISTLAIRWNGGSASSAPSPPSVVAVPPSPTIIVWAPWRKAISMSSPTPRVVAVSGSLFLLPPMRSNPQMSAVSM